MPLKIVLENYSLWIEYIFSIDVLTPIFFWNFHIIIYLITVRNTISLPSYLQFLSLYQNTIQVVNT